MIILDAHVHTSPISVCAKMDAKETLEKIKQAGYGAVQITNHYSRAYMEKNGIDYCQWLDRYIEAYNTARAEGEKLGLKIFFGAEVSLYASYCRYYNERYDSAFLAENYADYVLMGVTEEFLRQNPKLFDLSQKELYETCKKNGVLLFQAHPLRSEQGHSLKDLRYLDGLEINGSCYFNPYKEEILSICNKNGLLFTAGSDVHEACQVNGAGLYIPDEVNTSAELVSFVKSGKAKLYLAKDKN